MELKIKRIDKICKSILITLIVSMLFTGCVCNDILGENSSESFETGFKYEKDWLGGTAPVQPNYFHSACKSDKSEFNINFVILDYYYGGNFYEDLGYEKKTKYDLPCFEIYFSNNYGDKVLGKRVFENLVSEKYRCEEIHNDLYCEIKFNHSEKIWIPKKLFAKESGVIYIGIYGENQRYSEPKYECVVSMSICYKVTGNKVVLSAEEII